MTNEDRYGGFTPRRATKFYIPLLLQAFSQSLTYPLVAAIVTHGPLGVQTLTAYAQGQCAMFMISALGGGLVMTGMVFAKTRSGYHAFIQLNTWMMVVLLAAQALLAVPPFDSLLFRTLLNLPPDLAVIARNTLLGGIFMQAAFFLRNVPLVILFNARASFEANLATMIRIAITAATPYFFIKFGWTGALWGLTATTIPCFIEFFLTHLFARRYVRELPDTPPDTSASPLDQFRFTTPLAFGSFLLAAAPLVVATFVGRTAGAVSMLAIHYVTMGLANPVAYGALRMQPVAIQFPPEYRGDHRMIHFAVCCGLVLGLIPLVAAIPSVGNWYFHVVQNVPVADLWMPRTLMCCFAVWPVLQCVRGEIEGYAAWCQRPSAVLAGQITHLLVLTGVLALSLALGMPGWLMGFTAILTATASTILAIQTSLRRNPPAQLFKKVTT